MMLLECPKTVSDFLLRSESLRRNAMVSSRHLFLHTVVPYNGALQAWKINHTKSMTYRVGTGRATVEQQICGVVSSIVSSCLALSRFSGPTPSHTGTKRVERW